MSKKHKRGLESFVLNANTLIRVDEEGNAYLAICNYYAHVGIIIDEQTCFNRRCPHYGTYLLKNQKRKYKIHRKPSIRQQAYNPFFEISEQTGKCDVIGIEHLE